MILLLGATGYIGQAFAREMQRRKKCFIPLSRGAFDYTQFELLFEYVRHIRPTLVVNAAGYSGRPNRDACENERMATFKANTLLPQTVSRVCLLTNTPLGHVSSGCIYSGAKVSRRGVIRIERNLNTPELRDLFESHPERFSGFTELDDPNCTFREGPCSFLSGTKALAEEGLRSNPQAFVWRAQLPFSHENVEGNLLTRLSKYERVLDQVVSLSQVEDFARACLDLHERDASFGVYNVVNPGAVTTRQVVEAMEQAFGVTGAFEFWKSDEEFYSSDARAHRSAAILDSGKLLRAGVRMPPVQQALKNALLRWHPGPRLLPPVRHSGPHLQTVGEP